MDDLADWVMGVFVVVFGIAFVLCVIALIVSIKNMFGNFNYKTFTGEEGSSNYCYVTRGGEFCSKDGGMVQVEKYWRAE